MSDNLPVRDKRWPERLVLGALAFVLWLVTAAFGLPAIYLARQTVVRLLSRIGADVNELTVAGNVIVIVLAIVWIAYVIMAGERGLRRVGKVKGGWSIFIWGVGIEILILVLYLLV